MEHCGWWLPGHPFSAQPESDNIQGFMAQKAQPYGVMGSGYRREMSYKKAQLYQHCLWENLISMIGSLRFDRYLFIKLLCQIMLKR